MATLSRPASRSGRFIKADGRFIKFYQQWPLYQGRGPGQWPQWPFSSSRSGQIARSPRFGLRIVDFILPRIRSLSAAKPSHFYQGLAKGFAVLSRPAAAVERRWPFYQGRPASIAVLATVAALSRPGQWPQWPVYHQEAAAWPDL